MESGIYLTAMVLAVGALHLITRIAAYVGRYYAASGRGQARPPKAPVHRDDWYVFFHRSDLTGDSPVKKSEKRAGTRTNTKRRDSRPALRRYSA